MLDLSFRYDIRWMRIDVICSPISWSRQWSSTRRFSQIWLQTMYEFFEKKFFDILTICWNFLIIEKKNRTWEINIKISTKLNFIFSKNIYILKLKRYENFTPMKKHWKLVESSHENDNNGHNSKPIMSSW
jgi:hypothetical protein